MATRSNISVKVGNEYRTVYCHYDGYLSHNGRILLEHYNNQELAEELISYGDVLSLDEKCKMPAEHREKGYTAYFNSYEDDKNPHYRISKNRPKLTEEYLYVFENGKWHVLSMHIFNGYQELTQDLIGLDF